MTTSLFDPKETSQAPSPGDLIDLTIGELVPGGRGLARIDGRAIFVGGVGPGEKIRARITRLSKRHGEADLVEILVASPDRITPPCPFAGPCGGCDLMHMSGTAQTHIKSVILGDALRRLARIDLEAAGLTPIPINSPEPLLGYRHRATLTIQRHGEEMALGFMSGGSHAIVDIDHCHVLHPDLDRFMQSIRVKLSEIRNASPFLAKLTLIMDDQGHIGCRVILERGSHLPLLRVLESSHDEGTLAWFEVGGNRTDRIMRGGDVSVFSYRITADDAGLAVGFHPAGFIQGHLLANRVLVGKVLEWIAPKPGDQILDLFCGVGNYSLPLARSGARVTGVDEDPHVIASARRSAKGLPGTALSFQESDVSFYLANALDNGEEPEWVVLNPPRKGAREAMDQVAALRPRHILYVSCDPATLARDLVPLIAGGYRLMRVEGVDLYPQTHHVETITHLIRNDKSDEGSSL